MHAALTSIALESRAMIDTKEAAALIVLGWREWDWPENFDRFTAEHMAQHLAKQIRALPVDGCREALMELVRLKDVRALMDEPDNPYTFSDLEKEEWEAWEAARKALDAGTQKL